MNKSENYFEMEYKLTEQGSKTGLEIIQIDNRPWSKQEPE
jgi:hypothetical protein